MTQEEFRRTEIEAQNRITGTSGPETDAKNAAAGGGGPTYVITTEKIPGAKCDCIAEGAVISENNSQSSGAGEAACSDPNTRKYKCEVSS